MEFLVSNTQHFKGDANAPVTMIEFSDLQCPFCVKYYTETFAKIREEYVNTGKVRYVVREFPLTQIHPQARYASRASLCAGNQDEAKRPDPEEPRQSE